MAGGSQAGPAVRLDPHRGCVRLRLAPRPMPSFPATYLAFLNPAPRSRTPSWLATGAAPLAPRAANPTRKSSSLSLTPPFSTASSSRRRRTACGPWSSHTPRRLRPVLEQAPPGVRPPRRGWLHPHPQVAASPARLRRRRGAGSLRSRLPLLNLILSVLAYSSISIICTKI